MPANRTLPVPYFAQPTDTTCQGTVLKMMANYLDQSNSQSGAGSNSAVDIKNAINSGAGRPAPAVTNSHANMKWWLETNYPGYAFQYDIIKDQSLAERTIVASIDRGYPALVSISHASVSGHIVLVIGYSGYQANACSENFQFVVHDPYGAFDPSLNSKLNGKKRWDTGMCLAGGGEIGPGAANSQPTTSVSRQRQGDSAKGTYYLLYVSGRR